MYDAAVNVVSPEFMGWTILPASLMARAWTDEEFKKKLQSDPTSILRRTFQSFPPDATACLLTDHDNTRHLVLPFRRDRTHDWTKEDVLSLLEEETGKDDSLKHFLPAEVIANCYLDSTFKENLLADATNVLSDLGYETNGKRFRIIENSAHTYHLVLPCCPSDAEGLRYESLHARLLNQFGTPCS